VQRIARASHERGAEVSKSSESPLAAGTNGLEGLTVAFTGRLASMTHAEAAGLVREHGGEVVASPTDSTTYLVVGQDGQPLRRDGQPSESLERAHRLEAGGASIEIIAEQQFFSAFAESRALEQLYTTAQLSRLLEVPGSRIRSWVRRGFVEPVRVEHRLEYFDFQQVSSVKQLAELVSGGVDPERIRRSLASLRGWFPDAAEQLALLQEDGELLVRLDDGALADPSGQLRLSFDSTKGDVAGGSEPLLLDAFRPETPTYQRTVEELVEEALALETADQLEAAGALYHCALLTGGPRADIVFNLGNVLYALDRTGEAMQRYLQVLELDPDYVEAWNNLGSVLAEQSRLDEAVVAFERALALAPDYADVHFNLAAAILANGDVVRARRHAERYFQYDPSSHLARGLRRSLALNDGP